MFSYHYAENSKQKKRFDGTLPTTRVQMMDEDEIGGASSVKGSSDYSRTSSVTDEDLYGSKGPGVVARLMGLDSMPKSNTIDPSCTPLFDCYYKTEILECHRDEEVSSNVEPKNQKVVVRPIEKFQTEILPPKSAKSVPITHHKLLSPIKNTNFVSSKDAAEIMEAAARILEPGPQSSRKTKLHLKEKAQVAQKSLRISESSQKSGELSGVKQVKGNKTNKSCSSVDATPMRILQDSEESSSGVKSKGRSISLALQAKANVQKREALSSNSSRRSVSNEEKNESSPNMMFTSQKSTSNVLRQNNQKQNCSVDRGKSASKSANGDLSSARRQNSSKLVGNSKSSSRKLNSQVKDDKRHLSSSSSERTRKKRSVDGNYLSEKDKNREGSISDSEKMGTDVISFTFTAPMRSNEVRENFKNFSADSPSKRMMLKSDGVSASNFTFLARNVKGGDTLSRYLEQQLEELTHKADFISQHKSKHNTKDEKNYSIDSERQTVSSLYSLHDDKGSSIARQKLQGMCGRNIIEDQSFRLPSPVSVLELSSFSGSCHSSDSTESNHSTGASSTSAGSLTKRRSWELDYVHKMLHCNVDQMFNEYAMGRVDQIINPNLFDQLESCNDCGSVSRTSRRLMFDCVSECMDRRYRKHGVGGCTLWVKGVWMLKQKDRLAEDVCKEISGWSSMGDFMVDELVDRDMSCDPWLDYDVEGFEIGLKIEARILNSLIDEVVADILLL
ncbi:hypothetical protein ACS0TY_027788 [Phlomoides rotata]